MKSFYFGNKMLSLSLSFCLSWRYLVKIQSERYFSDPSLLKSTAIRGLPRLHFYHWIIEYIARFSADVHAMCFVHKVESLPRSYGSNLFAFAKKDVNEILGEVSRKMRNVWRRYAVGYSGMCYKYRNAKYLMDV